MSAFVNYCQEKTRTLRNELCDEMDKELEKAFPGMKIKTAKNETSFDSSDILYFCFDFDDKVRISIYVECGSIGSIEVWLLEDPNIIVTEEYTEICKKLVKFLGY